MKQYSLWSLLLITAVTFSSCEAIGGIFKAGVWSGIIVVVIIIAVVVWIFSRMSGRRD